MSDLEIYFDHYRKNIIGIDEEIVDTIWEQKTYLCWLDSQRKALQDQSKTGITDDIGPMVGNTHSESTSNRESNGQMHYHLAQKIV